MMMTYRRYHLLLISLVLAALAFAVFYLEGVLYLDPCPLCLVDRALLLLIAGVSVIAWLQHPQGIGRVVYAMLSGMVASVGVVVALRHIWLQGLPPEQVPECGPGLYFMLDVMPLGDVFGRVFNGSGSCAEVSWTFLGLSIPEQTLGLFVLLLLINVLASRLPRNSNKV
ncbi:MAG: disulfide bond formation protein B [Gammaproteobacteria bacterium]|jgi:disulfide bond formation protein DsbB|nr:disulfide bond formation protein B [Gammaproteobacteria bacterium]